MQPITPDTRRALLYVKKHGPVPMYEIPFEISRLDSMLESNYVYKIVIKPKSYPDGHTEYFGIKITADGKDALFRSKDLRKEMTINRIISIAALVISTLIAFTPLADWCQSWLSSLFH